MDTTDLDSILNGEVPASEPAIEPEAPQDDRPRDEQGRFIPKGEDLAPAGPSASPAPEIAPEPQLDHAALLGERRRRQEAEARAAELEHAIAQYRQPAPVIPEPADAPDMWEDPNGYAKWIKEEAKREAIAEMRGLGQQTSFEARLDVSEMMARDKHPDFDEKLEVFADLVKQNPALAAKMQTERHPAEYAYNTAKNYSEVQKLGSLDLDAMRAKMREEIQAEMMADVTAKLRPSLPPSLATERNVGNRSGPAYAGPKSISDILGS